MKHRDISSFFGKAPGGAGGGSGAAAPPAAAAKPKQAPGKRTASQAKENLKDGAPAGSKAERKGEEEGSQKLKRLRRASDRDEEAAAQPQEDLEDELEDAEAPAAAQPPAARRDAEQAGGAAAPADEAAAAAAPPSPAEAAKQQGGTPSKAGGGKVSKEEAAAAFKQMFGGGAKGAAAAKSPAGKGKGGGGKAAPGAQKQQQQERQKEQQQQQAASKSAPEAAEQQQQQQQQDPGGSSGGGGGGEDEGASQQQQQPAEDGGGAGPSTPGGSGGGKASVEQFKAAFKQQPAAKKAANASKAGGKLEGVGTGALAAAKLAAADDVASAVTWKAGVPVPYAFLAETFQSIASTTKRLEIVGILTRAFRAVLASTPADLLPAVYLCTNRVAPAHDGVELGVGDATLIKALAQATGRKESSIKASYEESGDLGSVAAAARGAQRTMFPAPPLTIAGVVKTFRDIARASGAASQDRKKGLICKLLVGSKDSEPGYIIRSLQAKLRIGLAEQSVLVAIAHAVLLHREGADDKDGQLADRLEAAAQAVKAAYSECPSYDVLIPALLEHPLSELPDHVHFMPGVPVRPMLAKPTCGVAEVLEKFSGSEFTCEYKYDGERVQIHVLDGGRSVHIYSRNAEDMTPRYPDVVQRLRGWLAPGVQSLVVDGEAVAWDPDKGKILPFQVLSTRARKEVALQDVKVAVCVFAFDCLYLDGRSLLREPLTARREALRASLVEVPGQLALATTKVSGDVEELEAFLDEAVAASTEGLIVKTLADGYTPSRRSSHWLKLKKDYLKGVGDTFDVVPIGAWHGKGKRAGVFGAYLLAVYCEEDETYQTISKLGTGFSEEALASLADSLRGSVIAAPRPYYKYGETSLPDVWFEPTQVWEVKAADLSLSPVHQAAVGLVDPGRGVSIRFPRLVRVREDKGPEDATSAAQVAEMYRAQAVVAAEAKAKEQADDGEDDDE